MLDPKKAKKVKRIINHAKDPTLVNLDIAESLERMADTLEHEQPTKTESKATDINLHLPGVNIVTLKGDPGPKGEKGDKGEPGKDGKTPRKGVDYFDGKDGRDGKDGKDGRDGVGYMGPQGPKGDAGSPDTPEQIIEKINSLLTDDEELKIDASHIKNLPKAETKTVHQNGGIYYLEHLIDVDLTNLADNQVLVYNAATKQWRNEAPTGGNTNLTDFDSQTAWRVFYSDGSGDVTELALGADGTFLKSNGAAAAPTWATPAGSGDVSKAGTPVNNQLAVWTGDGTIEGTADFTYDGTSLNLATGKNFQIAGATVLADAAGTLTLSNIDALDATTEATIEAAIDTLANLTTIQGRTVTLSDAGANAIFGWDDTAGAYENLTAAEVMGVLGITASAAELNILDGATLTVTELNYVDGVTSAIQTQLDGKQAASANLDEYAAVNPTAAGLALLDDANAAAQLVTLGLTATAAELNILDGATLTVTELNYVDGVTSAIQTQLDAKPTISSGAGAPASTPTKVGDIYIDTTNDDAYIAVGTASSDDWEKSNDGAGGSVADGDKGDITVSGSGATWTIDDDVVTYAKIQNVSAADRILGRITASAGDIEELTGANVRTIIGLATSDSPQFAGLNIGHASDTTITRTGAGDIAVEGNAVYRAGGTDVPVADGGTGASTAAGAVTNLGLDNTKIDAIGITIDGGGVAITTGIKGYIRVPYACTINSVTLLADQSGSIAVDIWKDTYANYPPTNADSITAAAVPTISSAIKSEDATLTGWTTSIAAGEILAFNVDSATTVQRVHLILKVTKT